MADSQFNHNSFGAKEIAIFPIDGGLDVLWNSSSTDSWMMNARNELLVSGPHRIFRATRDVERR